jgi:hypothetical protein
MRSPEHAPTPRLEETALENLGLTQYLDQAVVATDGSVARDSYGRPITGRNFMDSYPADSPHKEDTALLLQAFNDTVPGSTEQEALKAAITPFVDARFRRP